MTHARLDEKTGGRTARKAIRLDDSDSIKLSSYDLASIAYNMDEYRLIGVKGTELLLVANCRDFCRAVRDDASLRSSLKVPDGHRAVFAEGHATLTGQSSLVSRFWNREFRLTPALPKTKPFGLAPQLVSASRRSYNTLTILLYLMDLISPSHHWRDMLLRLIDAHGIDSHIMGFPLGGQNLRSGRVHRDQSSRTVEVS